AGAKATPVVVVLGDSLTAGYELAPDEALPVQLEKALAQRGVAARLVNAGVSGDTTANGLERFEESVRDAAPDFVVIALGTNDHILRLPSRHAKQNLSEMIFKTRNEGAGVALIGLKPRWKWRFMRPVDMAYASVYRSLSRSHDVPLFDDILRNVRMDSRLTLDGLHPNADGVRVMAENIAEFLAPHLSALSHTNRAPI
ncbi:MAG: GDSL-type esterase/lipase family protein, partial [Pseudomonadota bacterium]